MRAIGRVAKPPLPPPPGDIRLASLLTRGQRVGGIASSDLIFLVAVVAFFLPPPPHLSLLAFVSTCPSFWALPLEHLIGRSQLTGGLGLLGPWAPCPTLFSAVVPMLVALPMIIAKI